MPLTHVTIEHEFGAALHEDGLNIVSGALRLLRPELFEKSTDIVVKPPTAGPPPEPAHVLTLYALVNQPLAFNLYPIANTDLPEDSFFVQVSVREAAGTIVVNAQ